MSCVCKIKHNVDTCKSTSDSLQIFYCDVKKEYTGYCFSCAAKGLPAYVANPYSDGEAPKPPKAKTKEEIEAEIQEVRELGAPTFDYRGIPKEYFRKSGVRLAFSEYDGKTPFSFNFPMSKGDDLVGFKTVMLDKKAMWSMGEVRDCDLYNWKVAKAKGTKRLYITEGQWDCHALEYMLEKSSGGKYRYAVASIPNGVDSAAKTIGRQLKEIRSLFEEVVLVFDNDEPGQNAVREVQKVFPEVMEAPHVSGVKDANDALLSGNYSTFVDYVMWKARKPPMEGVVTVNEVLSKGEQKPELGLSYPWETMTDIMYGQRFSESTCIAGGVSCGKTVLAHEIGAWNAHVHKEPVFMALLEEANIKTCWNIAAKIDSIPYNRPEVYEANKDRYYETIRKLEDKLFLWNSTGSSSYRFDLKEILDAIRFNNMEYGCRFAFIDNMTRVVDQMPTTEANEFINKYSSEIANLATELDMHIYLFSHLNPPKGKDAVPHENGGEVYPAQLTGSRGIMRSFPNLVGFERNKYATEGREHNSFISIIKNRDYGNERKFKTKYDAMNTGRLLEYNWEGDKLY